MDRSNSMDGTCSIAEKMRLQLEDCYELLAWYEPYFAFDCNPPRESAEWKDCVNSRKQELDLCYDAGMVLVKEGEGIAFEDGLMECFKDALDRIKYDIGFIELWTKQ